MSRVMKPNKYVNTVKYDNSITNSSKAIRIHAENEDYHKATKLSHWLFVKYDMSYKTYRNKSKKRRDELRKEFESDTGVILNKPNYEYDEYDYTMQLLSEIGVPFSPDGTPLGI